jgi:hypothetical protein
MYTAVRNLGVRNVKWGSVRHTKHPAIQHESEFGVRRTYDLGTTIRSVEFDVDQTDAINADIEDWYRDAAGPARPFVIVPHKDYDDAWFVTFNDQERVHTRSNYNVNSSKITLQELSRGLRSATAIEAS